MKFPQHDTPDDAGLNQKLDYSVSALTTFQMVRKIPAVPSTRFLSGCVITGNSEIEPYICIFLIT